MPDRMSKEDILDRNPQVDPEQLEAAREMLRRLRERGVRGKRYEIVPPFGGRRASAQDDSHMDPPLIRSKRPVGTD